MPQALEDRAILRDQCQMTGITAARGCPIASVAIVGRCSRILGVIMRLGRIDQDSQLLSLSGAVAMLMLPLGMRRHPSRDHRVGQKQHSSQEDCCTRKKLSPRGRACYAGGLIAHDPKTPDKTKCSPGGFRFRQRQQRSTTETGP